MYIDLELWVDNHWQQAARLEAIADPALGFLGKIALEYHYDYALEQLGATGSRALFLLLPTKFELWIQTPWPAFLLDILPAGAARRSMLTRMDRTDIRASDWALLANAQFAPGNLRVRPTSEVMPPSHDGFARSEVIKRGPEFVEYAFQRGAPVAGSTGAQGEAPKFLLSEDTHGRWHADGAVADPKIATQWLVKFPRGRHKTDFTILAEEARYMELARFAGLRANTPLIHEDGCLFVPRFDRVGGDRIGLETIASLCNISGYGVTQTLQRSAKAIADYCTNPNIELCEFLRRDIFNLAVGNTDNHVRNTSVLKHQDGQIVLSPLYDVAPMLLDRSGIPRASRWGQREQHGTIDWAGVIEDLEAFGACAQTLHEGLGQMANVVGYLDKEMAKQGVDQDLIRFLRPRQVELAHDLEQVTNV